MKTLEHYIEESLLDDIDDLEKDSDDMVNWKTSICGEYYVRYVMVFNIGSTLKELDKQKIKKFYKKCLSILKFCLNRIDFFMFI